MLSPGSSSQLHQVRRIINAALQAFLAVVIAAVVYRYCWLDASDPFKCDALLNRGDWLDPGPRWSSRKIFQNWQPPGCMMHEYQQKDIVECFQNRRIVFVGDSTTRQIFWAVAKKMDRQGAEDKIMELMELEHKHKDLEFTSEGVTVHFIWDPWLNSTKLIRELSMFDPDVGVTERSESASLLLLGAPGLWYARHGNENYFKAFKDSIDAVIPYMDHIVPSNSTSPYPIHSPSPSRSPNLLLLAPVQVPRYRSLSPSREVTITPKKIDQMNDYLQQASAYSGAEITWSYSLMTWSGHGEYEDSGLHVIDSIAHRKADLLLNLRCNSDAALHGYPFNRTCCSNYTKNGGLQWLLIVSGMLLLPLALWSQRKYSAQFGRYLPSKERLAALTTVSLVICYCFYADRTQIFEKAHKQFHLRGFLVACSFALTIGLLSIQRTGRGPNQHPAAAPTFLGREQTDEWKGWMQAVILIYHFTGGSKILWIYELVRLLVASYLLMTGYGHTLYLLRTGDFSLRRAAGVLVRLNLLSCALPYLMRTNYAQYYFAPLVSFWFLVVFLTMKYQSEHNTCLGFLGLKITIAAITTTILIAVPGILEAFGFMLRHTCSISWDMAEWRFRAFLDMYIVNVGMVVAALYHRTSRLGVLGKHPALINKIIAFVQENRRMVESLVAILSILIILAFCGLISRSLDKQDYNWWHPFISFIPILSFVALRNSHFWLCGHHSTAFAWLGRYSLETYVLQYHIWLAGDSKGLLRIGLWNQWCETAILTVLFLWLSSLTAEATQVMTRWIVDGNHVADRDRRWSKFEIADERRSPEILPKSQRAQIHPLTDVQLDNGRPLVWKLWSRNSNMFVGDLRWRIGLILVVLWVCNITYT